MFEQEIQHSLLFQVGGVPEFERNNYFVVNDDTLIVWPWFEDLRSLATGY